MNAIDKIARRVALWLAVWALSSMFGCAEVTFKRGAGPDAMQATEQSCREKTTDVDAYAGCLRAAGYTYAKPSDSAALFGDQAQQAAANESDAVMPDATVTEETPAPVAAAGVADDSIITAPTVSVEPAERAGESLPQTTKPKARINRDPLAEVTVASWWKLGGTAGGLEADQGVCANTLGNAHRVAPNAKVVTIGMLRCLKDKGWFAVGR